MLSLPLAVGLALTPQLPSEWIASFLDGSRALERGELEPAIAAFERVRALLPGHAPSAFQLACARARAGEIDAAFAQLELVRGAGGLEAGQLEWEPWLAALREDARFEMLVAQARERASDGTAPDWELTPGLECDGLAVDDRGLVGLTRGGTLLDLASHAVVAQLAAPGERGWSAAVDPKARFVAWSSSRERPEDGEEAWSLRIHDPASGDLLRELGDPGWAASLQLDAKGERLVTFGAMPRAIRIFETAGWTEFAAPPVGSETARISPDGTRLLLVFRRGMERSDVVLWDVDAGRGLARHDDIAGLPSSSIGFDAGSEIAFVVDHGAPVTHLFEARTGARLEVALHSMSRPLSAFALPGAREVAVVEGGGKLALFDARTGERAREFELPEGIQSFVAATRDGSHLWMSGWFSRLAFLDARTGRVEWQDRRSGFLQRAQLVRGERELACVYGHVLERRDAWTGALLAPAENPQLETTCIVARTQPSAWIGGSDGSLRELELASGRTRRVLTGSDSGIVSVDVNADDSFVAFTDARERMRVLDATSGKVVMVYDDSEPAEEPGQALRVQLAPRGARALLARPDRSRALVDLTSGELLASIAGAEKGYLRSYWSAGGELYAVSGEEPDLARVYSARDGSPTGHDLRVDGRVETMAFDRSDEHLWIGSNRSGVHVFEVATGREVRRLNLADLDMFDTVELGSIAFSPDGRTAVTASSGFGVVAAWDTRDGTRLWGYSYSGGNPSALQCAFGSSGEHVYVSGQGDWSVRVVDALRGEIALDLADRGIGRLHPVVDERILLARTADGLQALDAATGRVLWSRSEFAREGWLLSTESGHVDGTLEALAASHLFPGERSYPLDALAAALLDPAKVRAGAAGVELTRAMLPAAPTLEWRERPPRVLELRAGDEPATLALEARAQADVVGFEQRVDGELGFVVGDLLEDGSRVLELDFARPAPGSAREYRWRAIGADGLASRALYLRVEGQ